jgi:polyferredoxin
MKIFNSLTILLLLLTFALSPQLIHAYAAPDHPTGQATQVLSKKEIKMQKRLEKKSSKLKKLQTKIAAKKGEMSKAGILGLLALVCLIAWLLLVIAGNAVSLSSPFFGVLFLGGTLAVLGFLVFGIWFLVEVL